MTYIDSALLDLTQWFCRQFQVLTGRTNVWLAVQLTNLSIIVYFLWAGVYFWSSDIGPRITLGLFCGGLLYVLTQTIFKEPIEAYESNACQRVAKGFRNPRRVRDAPLRISFLTLSLVLFYPIGFAYINFRVRIALLSYSLIVLTTAVLYLLACDPLPPCRGKARDWLRRLAPSRLAATESSSRCGSAWERGTWMESPPVTDRALLRGGGDSDSARSSFLLRRLESPSDPRSPVTNGGAATRILELSAPVRASGR